MLKKLLSNRLCLSAEVFPPKKEGRLEGIIRTLREISKLKPDFVSVTYGASGNGGDKTSDVASIAADAFDINTIAHLTAVNMTKEKLAEVMETYTRKNIKNLLVLRGDLTEESKFFDFKYANELAYFIKKNYPDFTLLGACYPEGHPESRDLAADMDFLAAKADSGIEAFITQLFLDNEVFYSFMDRYRGRGLTAPVSAGIMPILNPNQVKRIVTMCGVRTPEKFNGVISSADMYESGLKYAEEQIAALIDNGAANIHLYTMNNSEVAARIFGRFESYR